MILDDGGDATLLMHLGKRAEKDASVIAKPGVGGGNAPLQGDQGEAGEGSDLVLAHGEGHQGA